jgi:hypothetical protein
MFQIKVESFYFFQQPNFLQTDGGFSMNITHICNRKDQWIFEYLTALEQAEVMAFASRLRNDFGAEFREINGSVVELQPIAE